MLERKIVELACWRRLAIYIERRVSKQWTQAREDEVFTIHIATNQLSDALGAGSVTRSRRAARCRFAGISALAAEEPTPESHRYGLLDASGRGYYGASPRNAAVTLAFSPPRSDTRLHIRHQSGCAGFNGDGAALPCHCRWAEQGLLECVGILSAGRSCCICSSGTNGVQA